MTETERMYAYFICSIPMIGGVRAGQLLSRFGDPQGVYEAGTAGWREILSDSVVEYMDRQKKSGNLEEEYHSLGEKQIGLVLQEEEGFPRKLLEIPDPPYGLFYKGKLPEQKQPSVAVIGARECSEYGRFVAEELGRYLGSQGIQVISGMARGIDGISQQAALLAGGTSYGVLGCGVDICYPSQNRKLYEELIQKGGLLSTYAPGTKALPAYFPPRNRIVSGLADALIVIEARQKSGTLITVDMALEQGKDVYVVPGKITDRLSDGCNRLLTQGGGGVPVTGELYGGIFGELGRKAGAFIAGSGAENKRQTKEPETDRKAGGAFVSGVQIVGLCAKIDGDYFTGGMEERRIYRYCHVASETDGIGTDGICKAEYPGVFWYFCELTRVLDRGYS